MKYIKCNMPILLNNVVHCQLFLKFLSFKVHLVTFIEIFDQDVIL